MQCSRNAYVFTCFAHEELRTIDPNLLIPPASAHTLTPATMQNASAEVSMEWVLAHMEDTDFNDPLPSPAAGGGAQQAAAEAGGADPESVALLSSMGFTDAQATAALKVS